VCLVKHSLVQKDSSLYSYNIINGHCLQLLDVIQTYLNVLVNCLMKVTENSNRSGNNNSIVICLFIHLFMFWHSFSYTHTYDDFLFNFIAFVIHSEAARISKQTLNLSYPFKSVSLIWLYFFCVMCNTKKQTHWTTLWMYKYCWRNPFFYTYYCYW
jgi:hypothetical protein